MNKPKWAWVCAGLVLVSASAAFSNTKQTQTDKYNKFRLWPERGWEPISPEELKMASLPEAPGAPAVILYREVNRDDRVMAHEANYFRIKILTEEGRKYANVEIPYLRESEDVVDIKARSVQPDGSVVAFDGRATDQTILKAKGVQYLAKTFALPDVQVGSVVEYSYAVVFTEGYLYDSRWVLSEPLFTKQARFTLHSRPGYMLRWSWPLGLPSGNQPPQDDRRGTIRMEANNVPALGNCAPRVLGLPETDRCHAQQARWLHRSQPGRF